MTKQVSNDTAGGGIGLLTALFLIFLVLKLTGLIGWSWWWVTAPLWFVPAVVALVGILVCLFVGGVRLVEAARRRL